MSDRAIYLDHASSTPLRRSAAEAMSQAADAFGDPIQGHAEGRRARDVLEGARDTVAGSVGAQSDDLVFTSGGTESVTLGIIGTVRARRAEGNRVLISEVEHPSVIGAAESMQADGVEVVKVGVDETGRLDLDRFVAEVRTPGTILASVQHANHETGTLQPVAEAARLAHEAGVLLHSDAAQTVGKLPIDVEALGVDLLSLSGHKFGGPPGIGALYVHRGILLTGSPAGDARERNRRSGAENVPGAAAMAAAVSEALGEIADQAAHQWALTDRLRTGLAALDGLQVHGHPTQRAPHLACFSAADVDPEVLLMSLDERGFQLSCGCVSRGLPGEVSPVLEAMGVRAVGFRVSVGRATSDADVDAFLETMAGLAGELRAVERVSRETLSRRGVTGEGAVSG